VPKPNVSETAASLRGSLSARTTRISAVTIAVTATTDVSPASTPRGSGSASVASVSSPPEANSMPSARQRTTSSMCSTSAERRARSDWFESDWVWGRGNGRDLPRCIGIRGAVRERRVRPVWLGARMSAAPEPSTAKIPRAKGAEDYTAEAAATRRAFATEQTGAALEHVGHFSTDPAQLPGNVEHFMGVAQVPIGLAGPLLVDGEHAQGEFWVPLATVEGTLVASYNRGMKLLKACGGVRTTIIDDAMQRAPSFVFASAREARDFGVWLDEHFDEIAAAAEATTSTGKLRDIEQYPPARSASPASTTRRATRRART
jgi:hypothetical protein